MQFEWISFLNTQRIDYVDSGPNTSRDHVSIRCPFCGAADPSQHLSISLAGKGWCCWRNQQHRGGSPVRLIQALINCGYEQARLIAFGAGQVLPDDFLSRVRGQSVINAPPQKLTLPKEFMPFVEETKAPPSARPFVTYLAGRDFPAERLVQLTDRYGLCYCRHGPFQSRIIFPVYFDGQLMTWTGRALSRKAVIRYKTLSPEFEPGLPAAVGPISNYLLWYDKLSRADADTLVLCEGPFDALRVNFLGRPYGIAATCFFTSRPGSSQIELLHELRPRFKRCYLLLDRDMDSMAMRLTGDLKALHIDSKGLPKGCKDPAELSREQLLGLFC
jgi:hypothetical protein